MCGDVSLTFMTGALRTMGDSRFWMGPSTDRVTVVIVISVVDRIVGRSSCCSVNFAVVVVFLEVVVVELTKVEGWTKVRNLRPCAAASEGVSGTW